jgi:hypothetical protein
MADDDLLKQGRDAFATAQDAETDNRKHYEDDVEFARGGEQWPADIAKRREIEFRPVLTINKLPAFIRQVVNDARQNKPSIKVHPADSGADPETAEVVNGLIRNIEYTSNADIAYDTAMECAVSGGFGYWRVGLDYAYEDSFDMDLSIQRIANPLSVYGDPHSTAADSSDWMDAFVVDLLSKSQFETEYGKGKTVTDWDDTTWGNEGWRVDEDVTVAEWWHREQTEVKVSQFLNAVNGEAQTYKNSDIEGSEDLQAAIATGLLQFKRERLSKTYKVTQRIMSGAEILKTNDWLGCYIPIVPCYGDEYYIKGKRHLRSLINPAKDAQRQFNYWRTTATELVALAPRVPFLGRKGTFDSDAEKWATANTQSHAYLEYDTEPPIRLPLDSGTAGGALQEALNASDDMKAVMGIYDASLGARSNETSGRAIMARQREGDVSTFHFTDNLNRAIRHTGRILIDLIPHVYSGERVIRVMGEDGTPENKQLGKEYPQTDPKTGQPLVKEDGSPMMALHDLSVGKYDLTVTSGPSFTTRREEAAFQMTEMIRALPASAPILGKHLAKNLDWPGADEIAEELEAMSAGPQIPPEVEQMIEEGKATIEQQGQEIQTLKQDTQNEQAKIVQSAQQARDKIASDERIKREQIASDERIARERIASEQRLAALKDDGVEVDGPDGEKVVKTKADLANEGTMSALQGIAELIVQSGQAQMAGLERIAAAQMAPTELVVDPATGRKQARKVLVN